MKAFEPLDVEALSCAEVQVVVLMGGTGSRLKEETVKVPKPLVDINGRPFFEYQLRLLLNAGFRKFLFLVGYKANSIEEYFGSGEKYGCEITYSYDGEELLGTGGAVVKALPCLEEDFLLLYGDSFMDVDYFEIIYRYLQGKRAGGTALMTVMENADRFDKSNARYAEGELLCYDKRNTTPEMRHIDYGIQMFSRSVFQDLQRNTKIDLADIQHALVEQGSCAACEEVHRFYEIGTPASLEEFRQYARHRFDEPHPVIFLDRDGVINEIVFNEETEQLDSPLSTAEFAFRPGAVEALRELRDAGYELAVVTNQPAAAKGKTTLARLYDINRHMVRELEKQGVPLEGLRICPHHPAGTPRARERFLIRACGCRKPAPGMPESLMKNTLADRERSFMIGDSFTDVLAGRRAGLKTAFVGDYKCDICGRLNYQKPDILGQSLADVARKIIQEGKKACRSV